MAVCNGTLFLEGYVPQAGLKPGIIRLVGQHLHSELPGLLFLLKAEVEDKMYKIQNFGYNFCLKFRKCCKTSPILRTKA